jgi:hypothetical protein
MKNEIENHLQSGNTMGWWILAGFITSLVSSMKKTTKEVVLPLVLGDNGSFIPSYPLNTRKVKQGNKWMPKFTVFLPEKLLTYDIKQFHTWLIQVANNMITGNYSSFGDALGDSFTALNSCRVQGMSKITTLKDAVAYLTVGNSNWTYKSEVTGKVQTRLEKYISEITKAIRSEGHKQYKATKESEVKPQLVQGGSQGAVISPCGTQVFVNGQWLKLADS